MRFDYRDATDPYRYACPECHGIDGCYQGCRQNEPMDDGPPEEFSEERKKEIVGKFLDFIEKCEEHDYSFLMDEIFDARAWLGRN